MCAFDHGYVKRAIWRMKICTVTELGGGLEATYAVHLRLIGKLVGDFLLVIIELFSLGAFVLSQYTRLTDRRTDRISTARCDLTKLDAHKKQTCQSFRNNQRHKLLWIMLKYSVSTKKTLFYVSVQYRQMLAELAKGKTVHEIILNTCMSLTGYS